MCYTNVEYEIFFYPVIINSNTGWYKTLVPRLDFMHRTMLFVVMALNTT